MAIGLLPFKMGLLWALAWALLALTGAYLLNPFCVIIFLVSCLFETIYCLMWKSSYLKTVISGAVKTSGAVAAVFAVDPDPAIPFLVILFLWLFFWEVGGQNIPNDWADIEEDRLLKATSVPVCFGEACAGSLILFFLTLVVALNLVLWSVASRLEAFPLVGMAASFCAGAYLLLVPAFQLYKTMERSDALALFNRASYYPVTILAIVILNMIVS
jgi:4-hydroxybenzoate polyprenyltransferase